MERNQRQIDQGNERLRLYYLGSELEKLRRGELKQLCFSQGRTPQGLPISTIHMLLRRLPELHLFVKFADGNKSIKMAVLDISTAHRGIIDPSLQISEDNYYERWEKVAQGLGHLHHLRELRIVTPERRHQIGEARPDYRALCLILKHLPQLQTLIFSNNIVGETETHHWQDVANELGGHTNLQKIRFERATDESAMNLLCGRLMTIPRLSCVEFGVMIIRRRVLPDSFRTLLGMQSLTELSLQKCHLRESICLKMAEQLELEHHNSYLRMLDLQYCHLEGSGLSRLLSALQGHAKITMLCLSLTSLTQQAAARALGKLVSMSTSLEELRLAGASFLDNDSDDDAPNADPICLHPLFAALQSCSAVKVLKVGSVHEWSRDLAREFRVVLESNRCSIEKLSLHGQGLADAWHEIMPSMSSNRSLKRLNVMGGLDRQGAIDIGWRLAGNTYLEELSIIVVSMGVGDDSNTDAFKEMDDSLRPASDFTKASFVEALGENNTLKSVDIRLPFCWERVDASNKGMQLLQGALKHSYGISCFEGGLNDPAVEMICILNAAGRRYLTNDPSSPTSGVRVLSAVADNLDAIFFHLLENPSLCTSRTAGT